MSRGALLALAAMKKGLTELQAKATKAKQAADACAGAPGDFIAIQREAIEVMRDIASKPAAQLKKLEALKVREETARRLMKQDFVKLLDKQFEAEQKAGDLADHISTTEFHLRMRGILKD